MASLFLAGSAAAQTPAAPASTPPAATPTLFNPNADASADIRAARERAQANHRNVLVMWGDNKAPFCSCLNDQLHTDARLKLLLETEFEMVYVDTGRFEKNIELGEHYQTDFGKLGVPDLTVIDAAIDSVVAVLPGRDAIVKPPIAPRCFDTETLFKFLDNGKARKPDASKLLSDAQAKAKSTGKPVLVSFGEANCAACAAWDRTTANSELTAILNKYFVLCKIDSKRNPGAADAIKRLSGADAPAKPSLWMTFLDGEGKAMPGIGKMPNFDPADSAKPLMEWMLAASGGKMTPQEHEKIVLDLTAPQGKAAAGGGGGNK